MMNKHAKSPCCNAPVCRYGKRRRQCIQCKKTWSIRRKKRGRKSIRPAPILLENILEGKDSAVHSAKRRGICPVVTQKRVRRSILKFLRKTDLGLLPKGKLILIVDGLWTNFRKEGRFTLYLMAVRGINDNIAHFLDPVLLPDRESLTGWEAAIAAIPQDVETRICSMVSDGLRGIKSIAEDRGWHFQRCHFHLLASFQKKHGQWFRRGKSKWLRDAVTAYIQELLETADPKQTAEFSKELLTLINHHHCPKYIQMRVREFLRTMDDFKTYLRYPELNLPVTSNTVETMIRLLRNLLKRIHGTRTPNSFLRWTTTYIRWRKTIACNGKKSTELSF